ncbi:hypothetical protein DRE_02887 [Drechslerella stenobrocha 248]|uniref:Phosphoribosyltransferase domain-containing protein n=1 Tax=Drechslerella stenobrocha 248 TaxID=1043628 RepID=W7I5E4_9PEZI|nr:hypothetical protein DRE_02887 [Drechslerella stenobrocha 248]
MPEIATVKPTVIGIYGVPGCGKSFLIKELEECLRFRGFQFYEGSKMIADLVPGGLDAFKKLGEGEKSNWRQLAIETIGRGCLQSGQTAVVAGHFMFWPEETEPGVPVYTESDLLTFTHILYLDVPTDIIRQRCRNDRERSRPVLSLDHLHKWQEAEKTQLRHLCRQHGILFSRIPPSPSLLNNVSAFLLDFQCGTEESNLSNVMSKLDQIFGSSKELLDTVLVLDADRTLTALDSGKLFWENLSKRSNNQEDRLKSLFSSPLGYSYTAFRQATLLYEETVDDSEFESLCGMVASAIEIYPEFSSLLKSIAQHEHVGAVVVTCGLRLVWDKVLERLGVSEKIKVVGGGRISDGLVVTAEVKAAVVTHLRAHYNMRVWAFGDSVLDLPMLCAADQAIVVVGEKQSRSKTMEAALSTAIGSGKLLARQALLPSTVPPRLDTTRLPVAHLANPKFVDSIVCCLRRDRFEVLHATERSSAKFLMTPTRDAAVSGPALREAHRRIGWYLATEFLGEILGLEEYPIPHVQGHYTSGYRMRHEAETSIVALMRGGEPMALGVNDALPSATFVHAKNPSDIKNHHLLQTVVLVDSVINNGETIAEFVQYVRELSHSTRIVVVAGVVQSQSISTGRLAKMITEQKFSIIALRLSDNKFTGKGTTDTGNRLFNTTHIS